MEEESALLEELTILEVTDLFVRARYRDVIVHPEASDGATYADLLVRTGVQSVYVVVRAWDSSASRGQDHLLGVEPHERMSDTERVRGFIRHAFHTKLKAARDSGSTLVVVRPFAYNRRAALAFDEVTLGDGVSRCVETDDETGEVVCRIQRAASEIELAGGSSSMNVFADDDVRTGLSAVCLYSPPYASPDDACFRLAQNAHAIEQTPADMPDRLMSAHLAAVSEAVALLRNQAPE
jgi:hypothetical protein